MSVPRTYRDGLLVGPSAEAAVELLGDLCDQAVVTDYQQLTTAHGELLSMVGLVVDETLGPELPAILHPILTRLVVLPSQDTRSVPDVIIGLRRGDAALDRVVDLLGTEAAVALADVWSDDRRDRVLLTLAPTAQVSTGQAEQAARALREAREAEPWPAPSREPREAGGPHRPAKAISRREPALPGSRVRRLLALGAAAWSVVGLVLLLAAVVAGAAYAVAGLVALGVGTVLVTQWHVVGTMHALRQDLESSDTAGLRAGLEAVREGQGALAEELAAGRERTLALGRLLARRL